MGNSLLFVIIFPILFIVGFIPSFVAFRREHNSKVVILVLNIILGATGLAWIILLIWALSEDNRINYYAKSRKSNSYLMPKKECTHCKSLVDGDYTSCPKCGHKFSPESVMESKKNMNAAAWTCNKCGANNSLNVIMCKECGTYK